MLHLFKMYLFIYFNLSASRNRRPFPVTDDSTHTLPPPPPCPAHSVAPRLSHPAVKPLHIHTSSPLRLCSHSRVSLLSPAPRSHLHRIDASEMPQLATAGTPTTQKPPPIGPRASFMRRYMVGSGGNFTKVFHTAASQVPPTVC